MAEWSQLPRELVDLISTQLLSETDLQRFRSVCSSWRSSVQPLNSRFPILPNAGISDTTWGFYLSKRTIFRLSLPHGNNNWLIKVERDNPLKTHFMNPLTGSEFLTPLPDFPRSLNLLNFRLQELAQEYALQYICYRPNANSIGDSVSLYMEKVAFCAHAFLLLTIHVSGKLAVLRNGERRWTIINDLPSPYDDVVYFGGQFYAVDSTGRTVAVDVNNASVEVVAGSVFGGDKKFLVESDGELFMVDKYLSVGPDNEMDYDDENYEFYEDFDCFMSERTVKLVVYKLEKEGEEWRWVEVKSLGDRMLFLGDNCGFSASALEFPGCKGNCVFFTGQNREDDGLVKSRGVGVFDLESGSIGAVANDSGYSQLFWPPPRWLHSDPLNLEDGLDHLNI
ncbi:F-box protein SKIP23-like [Bidens hawaiensis]|uniref:F-box protein SKIP23-like n=1 Tax=Bidens hawaiensis TaxID=980011 RepID=UPI00404A6FB2